MDPFDLPDVTWTPVSPRLVTARRIGLLLPTVVVLAALVVGWVLAGSWWWAGAVVVVLALAAWAWWLRGRQARSIAYAERVDDLLVRRGILLRNLVVVPYGRLQYVDVSAGPVDRWLGIASVQLHTASAGSDAVIPGLVPAEAARLRDRLAQRGEARLAGL
jgi:membrane protein YdbS with pleckstrin-like domain